jgi:hypothetical protein
MGRAKNVDGRKLVVLSGRTKGTAFVLTKPQVNAGREDDNTICLKGKRVSRHHAVLVRSNGEYTLRDVSPRIGTLLNGRPTKEAPLKLGDRIRIGEFEMSYEATTVPAINDTTAPTPSQPEEPTTPPVPVAVAQEELVEKLAAENSTREDQRRIAELTQETERLVGGLKLANEALEFLRVQFQTQSDLQAEFTKWLDAVSQENAALSKRNSELQAKISELEASVAEADRVKGELVIAKSTLRQMSEELTEARKPAKPDEVVEAVGEALPLTPAERVEELAPVQTAPAEARSERDKISDLPAPVEQVAVEKHELQSAETKKREEAVLANRSVSDQTNEQFDRIRRSMIAKQDQKLVKTKAVRSLLSKFLRA